MKEEGGPQLKLLKIGEKEFNGQTYMSYQVKEGDKSVILFFDDKLKPNFNAILAKYLEETGIIEMPEELPQGGFIGGYEIGRDGTPRDTVLLNSRTIRPLTITIKQ